MRLAFSTNAFTRFSLTDALRGIRDAGFRGVEILADVPHAWPPGVDDAMVGGLTRDLERLGLEVSNVNANCSFGYWKDAPPEPYFEPSLISPNAKHRADRIALILQTLEFAKAIGARNISITSGRCLGSMDPAKAARQLSESLKPVMDSANRLGVDVGIELEPGLFLERVEELEEWFGKVGWNRLGANLDIGHSRVMGESIPESIKRLSPRIWNLHVEDLPGQKHYHMAPGDAGKDGLPWPDIRDALQAVNYNRYATVEVYTMTEDPHGAARRSFEFLDRLFHPVK